MAFSKQEFYPTSSQVLAEHSFAMGHSVRSQILIDLMGMDLNTSDLLRNQQVSRQTLHGHLRVLLENRFISVEKHIPFPIYRLIPDQIPMWVFIQMMDHPNSDKELILAFLPKELGNFLRRHLRLRRVGVA